MSDWHVKRGLGRKGWIADGIAYLPLTQGKVALLDPQALSHAEAFLWTFSHGYALRNDRGRRMYLHWFVLNLADESCDAEVDHINLNGLDNRMANLRFVTRSQNQVNRALQSNNTSGYRGVYFVQGKWSARIKRRGVTHSLGEYPTPEAAAAAYDRAALAYGGVVKLNLSDNANSQT